MDTNDELRAALQRRQAEGDAESRRQQELHRERQKFEQDEAAAKRQLYEAVDLAVEALARAEAPTDEIAITRAPAPTGLWRFFERQQHAVGWEVSLGSRDERVLCPDGTLITPETHAGKGPVNSTLRDALRSLVDNRLRPVRLGQTSLGVETQTNFFAEAFGGDSTQGQQRQVQAIRERLSFAKQGVTETLADILHQIGVPAI